ncbi:MAG TPA: DUF481 domain-containing protein [Phycisphaerae bacterium]|nr:DUF481 domain-containing protein [Phycisphaerae bacterium]HNU44613.1 DUF481 domain-containing protein [Phycisphaerae bacterium]
MKFNAWFGGQARMITLLAGGLMMVIATAAVRADVITTTDGSRLVGKVTAVAEGKLTLVTGFAGTVTIELAKVQAISTDESVNVRFDSGDQLVGKMQLNAEGTQAQMEGALGPIPVEVGKVEAIWPAGAEDPRIVQAQKAAEAAKPKWSATLEAGATKKEGNTDTFEVRGRGELRRKTVDDLLKFYIAADYAEQNDTRNRNEYLGGVYYEYNITERFMAYGRGELEHDEFENLDLRATAAAGVGYYWLKKPHHEFKTRAGGGYRHEAYEDGRTVDDPIADLGMDYRLDISRWAQFTHSTTYSPSLEEFSDYRLVLDTALAFPLANSDVWKLKLGVKNEYNSNPQPGVERLDNTYYGNIVLELK